VITLPAAIRTSSPGIRGVVTIVSLVVVEAIVTAWAVSIFGIQIVYGITAVFPAVTHTATSYVP
jgi:hypothetical protein